MTAIGIDFGTENTGAFVEYGGSFRQIGAAAVDQKHLPSHVQYDHPDNHIVANGGSIRNISPHMYNMTVKVTCGQ